MSPRLVRPLLLVTIALLALSACSSGPADETELCGSFDALGKEMLGGNVGVGNPLFRAADSLAGVADRYEQTSLSGDATSLRAIADSDETDANELRNATMRIAKICGHPLGLGTGFGRG